MDDVKRAYIAIDLKSYYASVECVERGLDPLDTNLVAADENRSTGTISSITPPGWQKVSSRMGIIPILARRC